MLLLIGCASQDEATAATTNSATLTNLDCSTSDINRVNDSSTVLDEKENISGYLFVLSLPELVILQGFVHLYVFAIIIVVRSNLS